MRRLRGWFLRLRGWFNKAQWDRELAEELESHLQLHIDDNLRAGMTPQEARRQALIKLGGVESVKESCRERYSVPWLETLTQDVRFGLRILRRNPGFTTVAVLTLAIGIGANTAMFSVVQAVLLRPLPYPESDQLVRVWSTMPAGGVPRSGSALPDYRAWRSENRTFVEMGAYHPTAHNFTGVDPPERLQSARLTASVWSVLRVRPLLGNVFVSEAEQWGRHRVVVLSEALWQRRFLGEPGVIGRTLRLNDEVFTIIGVMPASFEFPNTRTELWTPISYAPGHPMETRSNRFVEIIGRLKPGTTVLQAQADLSVLADQISRQAPENAGLGVFVMGWQDFMVGDIRMILLLLVGAVGFVLLIACANVANLLLARSASRQGELSVRVGLGAGRRRLFRQLLTESVLLAGFGGLLSFWLAFALVDLLPLLAPAGIPRLREVSLDATVLSFTAGLALLAGLAFGLWPAWHAASADVSEQLKASPRSMSAGRAHGRARNLLIIVEVSLSLVLLVGAGLLILSLVRVQQVDPGFRPDHLLTMQVTLPPLRYSEPEQIETFVEQTLAGFSALPGISAAGATTALPLGQSEWGKYFTIEGRPAPASLAQVPNVNYRVASPDYFRALGATLRLGRFFMVQDRAGQPPVAVINETIARRFWPDQNPIGKRILLGPPESLVAPLLPEDFPGGIEGWRASFPWMTIVGIVGDLRHYGQEREANPEVFVPIAQAGGEITSTFYLIARTATAPLGFTQATQAVIHGVDPNQPVANVRTMEMLLADSLDRRRFTTLLLGMFAGTAIALTLVGLYGVMAYTVSRRRKEMGIRFALGAQPRDLFRLVVGQGLRLAGIGIALGLVLSALLSRLIASQLFQVNAADPAIYAGTALLLLACAGLACWVPSRRAMQANPAATLRDN